MLEEVAKFQSMALPGKYFTVSRDTDTGEVSCDCLAYRYVTRADGTRRCKHIEAWKNGGGRI